MEAHERDVDGSSARIHAILEQSGCHRGTGRQTYCLCRSGSMYYNYKGFNSIVLLALVDADYRCIMYDLGAAGRSSDAGVFVRSAMKAFLEAHVDDLPGLSSWAISGRFPATSWWTRDSVKRSGSSGPIRRWRRPVM